MESTATNLSGGKSAQTFFMLRIVAVQVHAVGDENFEHACNMQTTEAK